MRLALLVSVLFVVGCPSSSPERPDGSIGNYRLLAVGGDTIGMGYGEISTLKLQYLDDLDQPIAKGAIRFGIFGDPNGSTLSSDRAVTGNDGTATLRLTAGAAEAQFRVVASADNATDLQFNISISQFAFVEVDAQLTYVGPDVTRVASMEARLYNTLDCASLSPSAPLPLPLRWSSAPGIIATILFPYLLCVDYALVGRALDQAGRTIAFGCVDLAQAQLFNSPLSVVLIPLERVLPSIIGNWSLSSELSLPTQSWTISWQELSRCPTSPAQPLLDKMLAIIALSDPALANALAGQRGPLDGANCRPATAAGNPTADGALITLLSPGGAPATKLAAVNVDISAMMASGKLHSLLNLTSSGGNSLLASHKLQQISFIGAGIVGANIDLVHETGYPIVEANGIQALFTNSLLSLDHHCFTLRLPALWQLALSTIALIPRGLPSDTLNLLKAVVGAAQRSSLTGCEAVADLLCSLIADPPSCDDQVETACTDALPPWATELAAGFAAQTGMDLCWEGSATAVASSDNLQVTRLTGGIFSAQLGLANGPLTALLPWSATPEP